MPRRMSDFDSVWKESMERYFEAFMAFFFPDVHEEIDWSRPPEFLDKELQYAVRVAGRGRRTVDALAKVWRHNGEEARVLAHVEAQSQPEQGFTDRMHLVNTLLRGRHECPVASFGILGDSSPDWRPDVYESSPWGTTIRMEFSIRKLLDWEGREEELAVHPNPFAIIVLAHLKTLATRRRPESRLRWKVRILRWLAEQGRPPDEFADLFRFIDLMMTLPVDLEKEFAVEAARLEEEKKMPLLSHIERWAMRDGEHKGAVNEARDSVLDIAGARFDTVPEWLTERIQEMDDLALLRALRKSIAKAKSLDEFAQALPS